MTLTTIRPDTEQRLNRQVPTPPHAFAAEQEGTTEAQSVDDREIVAALEEMTATPVSEPEPAPQEPSETTPEPSPSDAHASPGPDARRLRKDRIVFYLGIILTAAGGFGLTLGSVLHDSLRVPWFGTAYGVFGPLNQIAAAIGGVILLVGLVTLRLALRGGVLPDETPAGG